MKAVQLARIITHDGPGEFRAAALDQTGRPCRLFSQRWGGAFEPAQPGDVLEAYVRSIAHDQGGLFLELEGGEEVFLSAHDKGDLTVGQKIVVEVLSAQRRGKLARVRQTARAPEKRDRYPAWKASLPGGPDLTQSEDPLAVAMVFEDALTQSVTLLGGGQIHIERTKALVAVDVDSSGRSAKGSSGANALSLNREAAAETARQVALRGFGGAVVLDCVEPINRAAGEQIRDHFLTAFQAVDTRRVSALPPSKFGMMQAALAWAETPVEDKVLDETGTRSAEARLLDLLRDTEREAQASGARLFSLSLSSEIYSAYLSRRAVCDSILMDRFGGRIQIRQGSEGENSLRQR